MSPGCRGRESDGFPGATLTFVAMCGEMRPRTGGFGRIRGLVRRDATSGGLARNRKDDLADVLAGLQTSVCVSCFGQRKHGQWGLLDCVVGDQWPDILDKTAADRCLLFDWSGA